MLSFRSLLFFSLCSSLIFPKALRAESAHNPIQHLVVIFNENVSFDHYFGTYPHATNPKGEPHFTAYSNTPIANTLITSHLLLHNPNESERNGTSATTPFRLDRSQASTSDQNHIYTAEQQAYDHGKADLFPLYTGQGSPGGVGAFATSGQVTGYYDGNTVTALWRYAQRFAMNDNTFTDDYGPSTPGAINLVSGQTNGMTIKETTQRPANQDPSSAYLPDGQGGWSMINDIDPAQDICSSQHNQVWMKGHNIGDLLSQHNISWGGFMGGFDLTQKDTSGHSGCQRGTYSPITAQWVVDYIPHHNWFQYYPSTSNPNHTRPSSLYAIGHNNDQANHEYDLEDFFAATRAGNMPTITFLKLPASQDAHAGYSDPLDEQRGTVRIINFIQSRPEWKNTAIIITYDDSDGWYDHAFIPPLHASHDAQADQLNGPGKCGTTSLPIGINGKPVNGRCGPGTRLPFLVLSPWVRPNSIDHHLLTQSSIIRFIEDTWLHSQRLGEGSFDTTAGDMRFLFDFNHPPHLTPLLLTPEDGHIMSAPP